MRNYERLVNLNANLNALDEAVAVVPPESARLFYLLMLLDLSDVPVRRFKRAITNATAAMKAGPR